MNILMALMGLDIGGAETHVTELSKELKRRGHNVIVASNGGVYERELLDFGIKHYKVPLQNKKPNNIVSSLSLLKKIIKDENIDIVHSHARIPSFLLGKLHKNMKFPFVTTAHWIFTTKYGLKYITDWGQKTLAVSDDIKKYLMDNYHIPEKDITVTVNGIDTEKFAKTIPCDDIKQEFSITEGDKTIVYVSRMDADRSLVAHQLISAIDALCPVIDGLKCIIVGGGNDFDAVKKEADAVNEKYGRKIIMLTGARTDINKIISAGSLFVGVSRAALEAMASEKPCIIAGNEGYIGLFDESKLDVALETNFCCRGCIESKTEVLTQDIANFFGMWEEDIDRISKYSRSVVLEHYSVSKMTDDAEKVYKEAMEER
ncbi:MAG: glycosyltransferase [Firmicutes bacterium]|nr:glycosyltransferase [Bacillota bacterium]